MISSDQPGEGCSWQREQHEQMLRSRRELGQLEGLKEDDLCLEPSELRVGGDEGEEMSMVCGTQFWEQVGMVCWVWSPGPWLLRH